MTCARQLMRRWQVFIDDSAIKAVSERFRAAFTFKNALTGI
jgi:hypothetical protein